MNKTTVSKIFSISLSLAMVIASAPIPASAFGPVEPAGPAFVSQLTPPEQFGYVASSYSPSADATHPRLIVIADLHAHLEVQRHIEDMLDFLVKKLTSGSGSSSESVAPIFVEGGWSEKLEHPLSRIHNADLRSTLAQYFMAKAEMPASQAYSERYPNGTNFTLTGVENYDEYQANRERFIQTYPARKRLLDAIARHEQAINDLENMVQPGVFGHVQQMRKDYFAGKISPEKYAKGLVRMASRYGISNSSVEMLKNSANASAGQMDMALHIVYKAVLFAASQGKPLTAYFRKSLGDEAKIRENLVLIDTYLDLLKRTLSNQLTPEEVPLAFKRISEMAKVADLLVNKDGMVLDTTKTLQDALAFYPLAIMRDTSLVENSLKALDKNPSQTTGILVAGGFHVGTISDYLREHRIPFMVINPTISRDLTTGEQINYVKRMAREHVTLDEMHADFANGFGRKTTETSALGTQPIGNTAIEPLGQVKPDSKDPKAGAFGEKEDALLGALHAKDEHGNPLFVSRANGFTVSDGVTVRQEDAARLDAVQAAINSFGFFEAKVSNSNVAKLGATFSRRDGDSYERSGDLADDISPVIEVALQMLPEKPAKIHAQVVSDDVYLKLSAANSSKLVKKSKDAIILGIGEQEQVILISEKSVPNIKAAKAAVENLKAGDKMLSQEGNAALKNQWRLAEEIAHGLGNFDATQGQQVDVARTGIFLGLVAKLGEFKGVEHSATAGLSAVELPSAVVNGALRAVNGLTGDAAQAVRAMTQGVQTVSLGSIVSHLQAGIDLEAQRDATAKSLADDLQLNFPQFSETRRDLIEHQVLDTPIAMFQSKPALIAKARKVAAAMDDNDKKVDPDA